MPNSIELLRLAMTGNHIRWIQRLNFLNSSDPFLVLGLYIYLEKYIVYLSTENITANRKLQIRHPETSRVIYIRITTFERLEYPAVLEPEL